MTYDPFDDDEFIDTNNDADDEDLGSHVEHITTIGISNEWINFRHNLATSMFNAWTSLIYLDYYVFSSVIFVWNHNLIMKGVLEKIKKWNEKEDEMLVAAMLDVLNSGSNYKSDNGFKRGFYNAVEQQLAILLPRAGIKAKPHIESPIKTIKSDWSAMHDMLAWNNKSGFRWDYNNDMLEAPQPVWQAYIYKANGRDAQTAADILSDINIEEQEATGDGLDDIDVDQPLNSPSYVASREESSTQRKRKRRNSWDPLMNSLKESAEIIGAEIRGATNTFNSVFGTEGDREELRNNLFAEMNKVEGLTTRECDKAVCKLTQNKELMVIFYKVDEKRKLRWVKNMLDDTA
ncbi:hypothetical protein L1987_38146 [Smallanthus sonchifolius]|uniref:Uncharacterized protein n=1 Tax=Smallanthus sonchifolius TaxID=185202 RepID=A0ACB9HJQ4_9ASTR|nr:hypothetical protein L1987_38146 [Smallanthus sonchifolius]